ncbi:RcnB family protein [Roseibium litorale]|uniref:RcnB family protein n=1 Tax=Roseibium litorale TaxID=2803841 RepID=A0ABR9CNF2_9HYPH|nr:RcnB family protein [Roseibium litorale]MBD8892414.1 RcnB family protein [Roseibium litorale]
MIWSRAAAAMLAVCVSASLAGAPSIAAAKDKPTQEELLLKKKKQQHQKQQGEQKAHASKPAGKLSGEKLKKQQKVEAQQKMKKPASHAAAADWKRTGGTMPKKFRGAPVDYKKHHLKQPPKGYKWVRHNNDYVLVAISTGIVSAIISATR